MLLNILIITLIVLVINAFALIVAGWIKGISKATGKTILGTIKFIIFSPFKFISWSKQSRKNRKEFRKAKEYKKAIKVAVDEFLYGEWAENRVEVQGHPLVAGHKEMAEAAKAMEAAEAKLKELANAKKKNK